MSKAKHRLSEADRATLQAALNRGDIAEVAKKLGLGRETVARLACGLAAQAGSVALCEKNLPALAPPAAGAAA